MNTWYEKGGRPGSGSSVKINGQTKKQESEVKREMI